MVLGLYEKESRNRRYEMIITKESDCMCERYNVMLDGMMANKLAVSMTFTFSLAHPSCISHTCSLFIASVPS